MRYDILSHTKDGETVAVCTVEAKTDDEARRRGARFCRMMGCIMIGLRLVSEDDQK